MQHHFDKDIAVEYGIIEAILLNNIQYWLEKNEANNENYYDGSYWTYNSIKAFNKLFPYCSERQIQNALKHLKEENIIKTGNYNVSTYDRTLWYAFTEKGTSIMQKCKMETAKMLNGNVKNVEPIPNNKPNNINKLIFINNWEDNLQCEQISKTTNEKCCRRSCYNINGKNYCNQHSKPIIKNIIGESKNSFIKPTLEEVKKYCLERKNNIDPEYFIDFYESKGWCIGDNKMKDWKACVRTWEKNNKKDKNFNPANDYDISRIDESKFIHKVGD